MSKKWTKQIRSFGLDFESIFNYLRKQDSSIILESCFRISTLLGIVSEPFILLLSQTGCTPRVAFCNPRAINNPSPSNLYIPRVNITKIKIRLLL